MPLKVGFIILPNAVSCRVEVNTVKKNARSHGVNDMDAAMALLTKEDSRPKLSDKAQYVRALMSLRSHEGINAHKQALPLHMPGNTGIHLHASAGNVGVKKKLIDRADKLFAKMPPVPGLRLGQHWPEDLEQYKTGLQELRKHLLSDVQIKIEVLVFKRLQILNELNKNKEGNKNHTQIQARLQTANTNMEEQVAYYFTWKAIGTSQPAQTVTTDVLKKFEVGDYPWKAEEGEGNGSSSAQSHYGSLYRTAINQLKRSEEERGILKIQVIRLLNRLEEIIQNLTGKIHDEIALYSSLEESIRLDDNGEVELSAEENAETVSRAKLARGRECLLNIELKRVEIILKGAEKKLRKHLPFAPMS